MEKLTDKQKATPTACVVSVGEELLDGKISDTNAVYFSEWLHKNSVTVRRRATVGDDLTDIRAVLKNMAADCDLLIVSGGLGPTHDDVTREGVAAYLNRQIAFSPAMWEQVQKIFTEKGQQAADSNRKQADMIEGGEIIPNQMGTAPGIFIKSGRQIVILLPGPPRENRPMIDGFVSQRLIKEGLFTRQREQVRRLYGIGESDLQTHMNQIKPRFAYGCYFKAGGWIELHFFEPPDNKAAWADEIKAIERFLTDKGIYLTENRSLSLLVLEEAKTAGLKIAFAESLTAGQACAEIVENPGASAVLVGGAVVYDNRLKTDALGVRAETLTRHGAVSGPCAAQMAAGLKKLTKADIAVSLTGVAGPEGGSDEKPVGTVFFGFDFEGQTRVIKKLFLGQRDRVIRRAVISVYVEILKYLRGR